MRATYLVKLPLLGLVLARPAAAQVLIAPLQLYLDARAPVATFYVYNQSQQAQEITIGFRFGYPASDSAGTARMEYGDTLPLASRSMQGWVRAFPRQFLIQPGDKQEVRISARAPRDLAEGAYWTRLVTSSTPQQPALDSLGGGITTRMTFRIEQLTTVFYRQGSVRTAVSAGSPRVLLDTGKVVVLAPVAPGGNAPFFGSAAVRLLDEAGVEAAKSTVAFSMYVPIVQRFEFDRQKLHSGRYVLEVRITSDRDDISPRELLHIEPVVTRASISVP